MPRSPAGPLDAGARVAVIEAAGGRLVVEPLRVEHESFRDALLGKDADIVTLQQAAGTVAVANAAAESALTGRTVVIETSKVESQ